MLGAIAGDIIGSIYEFYGSENKDFPLFSSGSRFTDDSLLTIAVAKALLTNKDYVYYLRKYGNMYPNAGFGGNFYKWLKADVPKPYNSWGNGSAMRVSPVAYVYDNIDKVLEEAKLSAEVTHNHPEGIKGAQAVATCIFLARSRHSKQDIKSFIERNFCYDLDFNYNDLVASYSFDVSCQGSVPQAIFCFLISNDFEDAIRNAIHIGGDSDTIAAIAGSIAEAYYRAVPQHIVNEVQRILPNHLWKVVIDFRKYFVSKFS